MESNKTIVSIESGTIKGFIKKNIITYLGIPYAKAKRFMPPEKTDHWNEIFEANQYGNISPQENVWGGNEFLFNREGKQNEDCLNLNIWTPDIHDHKKRPVMVWLHGGGFQSGSSMEQELYDGTNLSKEGDVVVVSINHRLNILGFLDLEEYGEKYKYSGNVGMMDIEYALRWIQTNIEKFGGDKHNVTLFGQSGGGAKILTLMAMPSAKGLFHKVIIESGAVETSGMTLTSKETSKRVGQLVVEKLGIQKIDEINAVPYNQLIKIGNETLEQVAEEQKIPSVFGDGTYSLIWNPNVDGKYIIDNPIGNKARNLSSNIPMLIGSNFSEWSTFPLATNIEKGKENNKNNWSKDKVENLIKDKFGKETAIIKNMFKKAYPEKQDVDLLFIDSLLRTRVLKTINSMKTTPIYSYIFTYETPLYGGFAMSYHCAELPYIFNNREYSKAALAGKEETKQLEKQISKAWINFARYSNPNHEDLPFWPAYTKENGSTMIFDKTCNVKNHHDEELMKKLEPNYDFIKGEQHE